MLCQVSVQGFSQKLPVLLDLLLDQLASFTVKPERFAVVAESARREYANIAFQQVYQWAMYRAEVGQAEWSGRVCLLLREENRVESFGKQNSLKGS